MDSKTMQTILRMISDAQFAHAPDKDRDDEIAYRFHEGIYEGLQMAFAIVEAVEKKEESDDETVKPPIGIAPYYIVAWSRIAELADAISRYRTRVKRDETVVQKWANEIVWQCSMIEALRKKGESDG